ncbi:MAG: hypothetical protein Q4D65_08890 [Peptostreptococcaceae bacterium]|nr:hypothetical protein [Peptostreptococcaceae bacterium]
MKKKTAVRTFIKVENDIVIQVIPPKDKYISLDGHTRLYLAVQEGFQTVRALVSNADDSIRCFVAEAKRLGVNTPHDLQLLSHEKFEIKWNQYCNRILGRKK